MCSMRKVVEKPYIKNILRKGCGFDTPQEGSVCKIKVTLDEGSIVQELDEEQTREIIIGDCDGSVDWIIEDCIRTMKEKEECCIEINLSITKINYFSCSTSHASEEENCIVHTNKSPLFIKMQFELSSFTKQPAPSALRVTEKWQRATYNKQKGTELYTKGDFEWAFRRFGLALKYIISLEHDKHSDVSDMDIKGLKLLCYLNMAACQMQHHNFESVVINTSKALALHPSNTKALYRRGVAYLHLQEYEKSEDDLKAVQKIEPTNQAVTKQLQILKNKVHELNQFYADAMKKLFL